MSTPDFSWEEAASRRGLRPSRLDKARARLEQAALVVGEHFANETDPRWPNVHEYEAAALEFYKAVRAEQEGK